MRHLQHCFKHFDEDDISNLLIGADNFMSAGMLSAIDIMTVDGVLRRKNFYNFLITENAVQVKTLIDGFNNSTGQEALDNFNGLHKLCMGVWLENCNSFAITDDGKLEVKVSKQSVKLSKSFEEHTQSKKDSVTSTFYRQASIRQIERYFIMHANGLFEDDFQPKIIADIGSGTLIASAMMRERLPNAQITAYEPGLISGKTRKIARNLNIDIVPKEFTSSDTREKFDLIMLHFVLEHDFEQSKQIIRDALKMISPEGKISIGVPNFNAFHRAYELEHEKSSRDPETRLSKHDTLSGHQIIFTSKQLLDIISQVQKDEGYSYKQTAKTILPRPISFNRILANTKSNTILYEMEKEGHPKGIVDQGSVLAITIGRSGKYNTNISDTNHLEDGTTFHEFLID